MPLNCRCRSDQNGKGYVTYVDSNLKNHFKNKNEDKELKIKFFFQLWLQNITACPPH